MKETEIKLIKDWGRLQAAAKRLGFSASVTNNVIELCHKASGEIWTATSIEDSDGFLSGVAFMVITVKGSTRQ